jgi:hypothetical protein
MAVDPTSLLRTALLLHLLRATMQDAITTN